MIFSVSTQTVTIDSGDTTSDAVDLHSDGQLVGIITPSATTGTALTFSGAPSGSTYTTLYSDGADYSVAIDKTASKWVVLDPTVFYGTPYMKLVSNDTEGADRTFILVFRHIV